MPTLSPVRTAPLLLAAAAVFGTTPAAAQYSTNPAANLPLADRPGEQNQAKVRVATDGSTWVSWYDNSTGGFKPTVQLLTPVGVEVFPHNGITLVNTTNLSTVDYDLAVDAQGNALIAFADNSQGASVVSAHKVLPDGSRPWGAAGVRFASGAASNPKIAALSDGNIMVGWSLNGVFTLQRVSAEGALVGAPLVVSESGRLLTLSDLEASTDGAVIALWVRTFTSMFTSNKYLYAQRYDTNLQETWPRSDVAGVTAAALVVYGPQGAPYGAQGGSIQNGYFPTMVLDGEGGAAFGWYENVGPRNAYVQRVRADGSLVYPLHGLPVTVGTGRLVLSAAHTFDRATGSIFCAFTDANANQSQFGLRVQRFDSEGGRSFGDAARELLPLTTNQNSFTRAVGIGESAVVACFDARSATTGVVQSWRIGATGDLVWPANPTPVCSVVSGKARLDAAAGPDGGTRLVWGDARNDTNDAYIQNVNADGTLGPPPPIAPPCPADFDGSGLLNPDDLSDYITCYFNPPCAGADFDGNGLINPDDLSDFITGFFLGCP